MRPLKMLRRHSARRRLSVALALGISAGLLAACAAPGDGSSSSGSAEMRTVVDAVGEVELPVDPQRVVSTDFFSSSVLVDVGIIPVGTMQGVTNAKSRPPRYIEALADAEQISTYAEINVEKVLDLDPDLIIVDADFSEPETIERLAEIAPLFRVDLGGSWSERALSVADAVNKLDVANAQKTAYDERAAAISEKYRDLLDVMPLAVVSISTTDATWAHYAPGGWPTPVWVDIDAVFRDTTEGEAATSDEWAWISDEQLGKLDNAGIILILETDQLERWKDNPLWNSLPAVKAGNVFEWWDGPATSSFEWGQYNLDQVEAILSEVNPL